MDINIKSKRGRKPLPESERKILVKFWIKSKHKDKVEAFQKELEENDKK